MALEEDLALEEEDVATELLLFAELEEDLALEEEDVAIELLLFAELEELFSALEEELFFTLLEEVSCSVTLLEEEVINSGSGFTGSLQPNTKTLATIPNKNKFLIAIPILNGFVLKCNF